MFYRIRINGTEVGVFGHSAVENMHLSVGGDDADRYVFASATCKVGAERVFLDWIQRPIGPNDVVEIAPAPECVVQNPRHTFVLGRTERKPSAERQCDFCQRKEVAVPRLVYIDEHRPAICSDCVALCVSILGGSTS